MFSATEKQILKIAYDNYRSTGSRTTTLMVNNGDKLVHYSNAFASLNAINYIEEDDDDVTIGSISVTLTDVGIEELSAMRYV